MRVSGWTAGADALARFPDLAVLSLAGVSGLPPGLLARSSRLTELVLRDGASPVPTLRNLPLKRLELRNLEAGVGGGLAECFRGLRALENLVIHNVRGLTSLAVGALRDLESLIEIRVEMNRDLEALPDALLPASRDLRVMQILGNGRLTALAPGWFKDKPELVDCRIVANGITSLRSDTFDHQPRIRFLILNGNRLRFEEAGTRPLQQMFKGLPNIQEIEMDSNELDDIPLGAFDSLKGIQLISLKSQRGKGLRSLHPNLFRCNKMLASIRLMGNQLTQVPPDLLHGLTLMTKVDLSMNPALQAIPNNFFKDAPNMFKLYLYGTSISQLTPRMFGLLAKLGRFRTENCKITRIDPATLSGWTSLTHLDLAGNALTEIGEGTFADLVGLRVLELQGNRLTSLPKAVLRPLTGLTRLTLSQRSPPGGAAAADGVSGCLRAEELPDSAGKLMAQGCFAADPEYRRCMDPEDARVQEQCAPGAGGLAHPRRDPAAAPLRISNTASGGRSHSRGERAAADVNRNVLLFPSSRILSGASVQYLGFVSSVALGAACLGHKVLARRRRSGRGQARRRGPGGGR